MRAPLVQTMLFGAFILLGLSAITLAVPYDMPGLSDSSNAAPPRSPEGGVPGYGPYGPPCDDGQGNQGFFARLLDPGDGPRWTFASNVLALQRTSNRDQPLFTSAIDSSTLLSASNLDVPVALGVDMSAVRHCVLGSDFDLEVRYFQTDWALNTGVTGPVGMVTNVNGTTFNVVNPAIRYTSGLHLGEVNLRHEWCDGVTLLAGFRMGELDEHYHVGASGVVPGSTVTLDTQTYNHLYGFQVGSDFDIFEENGPLHLHLVSKTGIYGNAAAQRNHQTDLVDGMDQTVAATQCQAAVISEVELALAYEVNCHLTFRLTGSAVLLDCVALATDQIGTSNFLTGAATVNTHGYIFYYGGGAGLELKF